MARVWWEREGREMRREMGRRRRQRFLTPILLLYLEIDLNRSIEYNCNPRYEILLLKSGHSIALSMLLSSELNEARCSRNNAGASSSLCSILNPEI